MNRGVTLSLFVGPIIPIPAPRFVIEALTEVTVTAGTATSDGFELKFVMTNDSTLLQALFLVGAGAVPKAIRVVVAVEINGNPYRMDLPDVDARRAAQMGVLLAVNTDAHAPQHLARQEYGLVTARRAWLTPREVLNAYPWETLAERRRDRLRTGAVAVAGGAWSDGEAAPGFAEPERPVAAMHWPEPTDPTPAADTSADAPAPADPDAATDGELLTRALDATPLPDELRQRLDDWLRHGGDEPLQAALAERGEPMQVAFSLLFGA